MNRLPPDLCIAALSTTWGTVSIVAGRRGSVACDLPLAGPSLVNRSFRVVRVDLPSDAPDALKQALDYVHAALEGRPAKQPPAVHPAVCGNASPFQCSVWRALQSVRRGETISYAELARRAGHPRAVRATAGACGANPLPIILPCHRIVRSNGDLGGFSSGLPWKIRLLSLEPPDGRGGR
jgi:O-6-methylguanine DNA methyltransferase